MAQLGKLLAMLAAIAIILITLGGLVYGVIEDPAVVGPLAAAAVVVGVAIFQRRWEKSQELDRLHREQMSPIYKELVEMIKDIDEFSKRPETDQEAFFKDLSTKLILHGPTPVISAWIGWQRAAAIDTMAVATFVAWEGILRAVRRDLGHDNSDLASGDLLRLFLTEEDDDESRALWQALRAAQPT
jgi:hypothetical protein